MAIGTDGHTVFHTVLGSCVSVCLHDPIAGIGGMNHILLADDTSSGARAGQMATHAMELLINGLIKTGAAKERLEAKVFGGALLSSGLGAAGARNFADVRRFLDVEGLPCLAQDVGGFQARRLEFHPSSGRARIRTVDAAPVERVVAVSGAGADLELL